MPAQPQGNPRRSPGRSSPRAPSSNSPYGGALGPKKNVLELPPGHTAQVRPPITAGDFIGKFFAQDSLEFLRWLAKYFRNDNVTLCILLLMMGSQEVGGAVQLRQDAIAEELEMDPAQVSRSIAKLKRLGLVFSPKRGAIQLQPTVTLRGGYKIIDKPVRGSAQKQIKVQVEQLALLSEIVCDNSVPEEFKQMALPGASLPEPPQKTRKRKLAEKKPEA
ncbi:Rrf2 family transcriptional regulator (plasmid) [Streptomyces sp. NBC_01278]|uniref:hypothetical protein n=1 Tax=Streptomyces sp. NBC_01278 TaxID=2903809 RepID=UPI002E2F4A53|nr:hypothetical protein [Streptomyces sp. NBC_01278]